MRSKITALLLAVVMAGYTGSALAGGGQHYPNGAEAFMAGADRADNGRDSPSSESHSFFHHPFFM